MELTREKALELLMKYNKEPFHILHGLTVEGVMRWYAQELGYGEDADFWATVGLLHDIDFEGWFGELPPGVYRIYKDMSVDGLYTYPEEEREALQQELYATFVVAW